MAISLKNAKAFHTETDETLRWYHNLGGEIIINDINPYPISFSPTARETVWLRDVKPDNGLMVLIVPRMLLLSTVLNVAVYAVCSGHIQYCFGIIGYCY